jgi:GTP-binding protein EngB required for normal cell division
MDNQTLQLSKLIAFPALTTHYLQWLSSQEIQNNLHISHKIILKNWIKSLPYSNSLEKNSSKLLQESITQSTRSQDLNIGKKEFFDALNKILDLAIKIEPKDVPSKKDCELSLREWIEKCLITQAAYSEPSLLTEFDPWKAAIEKLDSLRRTKLLTDDTEADIAFPLSSYSLNTKPKTPTGIEPFDMIELEGGADEDTTLILSGETNIGKSHLGLFCLSSLSLRKEAVLLCSGEDSLETTRKRIFSHYLRRPTSEVVLMDEKARLDLFRELYGHEEDPDSLHYHIRQNVAIACIPEGGFSPEIVAEKIDRVEQKIQKKVKAFMCDYLQKMSENSATKRTKSMRDEELENTVNQIKDICQTKKSFGIVISQVPSHAAGGAQEFLNLKQAVARSYAATWGAHYVITMNRTAEETRRLASAVTDKKPRLNLFLCKNKDGPLGVCYALGFPSEARWEFFRDKTSMEREIESRKIKEKNL